LCEFNKHGIMVIHNDVNTGSILETNYFESDIAKNGYLFLSIFSNNFRLLIPERLKGIRNQIESIKSVIVTKGKMGSFDIDCIEMMFEDYTLTPLCIYIDKNLTDFMPDSSYLKKELSFEAYFSVSEKICYDAFYRISPLPCRKEYITMSL
jgi:hypothetical protein